MSNFMSLAAIDVRKGFINNILSTLFAYLTVEKSKQKCTIMFNEIPEPKGLDEVDLFEEMKNM